MPARTMTFSDPVGSRPLWMGDFPDAREHLLPFAMKLKVDEFLKRDAVVVTVGAAGAQGGVDEVQVVTVDATSGNFTLTYAGQTTGNIAEGATAAAVQTALEALSNINVGDVKVYGSAGGPFTVVFGGSLGKQNIAQMTATDVDLAGGGDTVSVATSVAGVAGATSIPVDALSGPIPAGTILNFGGTGRFAILTADAAAGATSLTVEALAESVGAGDTATYEGSAEVAKTIPSGTLVGRTYAERTSKEGFGPAATTDDEIYLLAFDVVDTDINDNGEAYRPGGVVKENYLPGWDDLSSGIKAVIRAKYACIEGVN